MHRVTVKCLVISLLMGVGLLASSDVEASVRLSENELKKLVVGSGQVQTSAGELDCDREKGYCLLVIASRPRAVSYVLLQNQIHALLKKISKKGSSRFFHGPWRCMNRSCAIQ